MNLIYFLSIVSNGRNRGLSPEYYKKLLDLDEIDKERHYQTNDDCMKQSTADVTSPMLG